MLRPRTDAQRSYRFGQERLMPKAPTASAPDGSDQDDPRKVDALERPRAKFARLDKEAEQLAEAMRQKIEMTV